MRAALLLAALLPAAPALADVPMSFRTPSDNIHCLIYNPGGPLVLDCELRQRDAGPPLLPRPVDCDLDWGNRFALSESGGGYMVCHGDTVVMPGSLVLPYGTVTRFGPFTCDSSESGLECRNDEGHGILLSRARQGVF
jgi:hypothetical protein